MQLRAIILLLATSLGAAALPPWVAMQAPPASGAADVTGESALYYFDANANDSSGNGYNLTLTGSPSFVTSLNGSTANGALAITSTSQYAAQTTAATIVNPASSDFTISGWFKPTDLTSGASERTIYWKIDSTNEVQLIFDSQGGTTAIITLVVDYTGETAQMGDYTTGTVTTGNTYHICACWNHATHTITAIYINAVAQSLNAINGYSVGTANNELYVGTRSDLFTHYIGVIDDLRIYPFVLTSTQVSNLYTLGAKQ